MRHHLIALTLLLPLTALAQEFNWPVLQGNISYSCTFGSNPPTNHQRYDTALRTCINQQLADPSQGYVVQGGRYVAGPVLAPEPEPEPPAPEPPAPEPVGPQPTTVTRDGETSLDALASFAYDGVTPYSWDWQAGFAQPDGRLEITLIAPPTQQNSVALISRGARADAPGTFAVWVWNNEVHASFGSTGLFRSGTQDLIPGQAHTITVSWGSAFTVLVDGTVTIHHSTWPVAMADRAEPVALAANGTMDGFQGTAAFAVFDAPILVDPSCGVGTLNFVINPADCTPTPEPPPPEPALGSVSLNWSAPTLNVDNTPLTDLTAYRLYWGPGPRNYADSVLITDPAAVSATVEDLLLGEGYYFAMTAINAAGEESGYSNEVNRVAE